MDHRAGSDVTINQNYTECSLVDALVVHIASNIMLTSLEMH